MGEATGKKEDFAWAVITAAATTLVVKLAEWAIEELRRRADEIRERADEPDE